MASSVGPEREPLLPREEAPQPPIENSKPLNELSTWDLCCVLGALWSAGGNPLAGVDLFCPNSDCFFSSSLFGCIGHECGRYIAHSHRIVLQQSPPIIVPWHFIPPVMLLDFVYNN